MPQPRKLRILYSDNRVVRFATFLPDPEGERGSILVVDNHLTGLVFGNEERFSRSGVTEEEGWRLAEEWHRANPVECREPFLAALDSAVNNPIEGAARQPVRYLVNPAVLPHLVMEITQGRQDRAVEFQGVPVAAGSDIPQDSVGVEYPGGRVVLVPAAWPAAAG